MRPTAGRLGPRPRTTSASSTTTSPMTGDDLRDFVNGKLFPYLQGFRQKATGPNTIEYKIGEIFGEIKNKIQSGYNMREVIDQIDELRFRSQAEKHELSHLYEAKIRNMGNAGRNGGEYYTPRPLIRAMVQVTKPQIGETHLRRGCRLGGVPLRVLRLPQGDKSRAHHEPRTASAGAHLLRQREEVPRLRDRHHEHDPARHRGPQHPPHQHAHREPRRRSGEGPLRRGVGQSALRRQGAQGGPAELPDPHRRDRLPVPAALHQDAQGRRARRRGHQEHLPLQHRQRLGEPAQAAAGELHPAHRARLPERHVPGRGREDRGALLREGRTDAQGLVLPARSGPQPWQDQPAQRRRSRRVRGAAEDQGRLAQELERGRRGHRPATWDLSVKNPDGGEADRAPQPAGDHGRDAALDAESAEVLARIQGALVKGRWQTRYRSVISAMSTTAGTRPVEQRPEASVYPLYGGGWGDLRPWTCSLAKTVWSPPARDFESAHNIPERTGKSCAVRRQVSSWCHREIPGSGFRGSDLRCYSDGGR